MIARALEIEIVRLYHTEHWPVGTIARQLRVHHATVRRVLAQHDQAKLREVTGGRYG